jgi:hypothetical protein
MDTSTFVGRSVTFTSTASGGYTPYSYQWYLNGNPVSRATSNTWTFTPTTSGIFYIYLKIIDAKGNTAQSKTARVVVYTVPVGGYSISLINNYAKAEPIIPYFTAMTIILISFTIIRCKTVKNNETVTIDKLSSTTEFQ